MAHVRKWKGSWQARYRTPEGAERSKSFPRKVDAERFLAGIEGDKVRGAYVDPSAGRQMFGVYARAWMATQVHRPTTAVQVETNMRRHVFPHFENRPLAAVRPSEIQAWVKSLSTTLAPGTVELIYRYVSAVFKSAVQDRLITSSPCVGVRLPKAPPKQVVPLATEQVEALVDAMPERYRALLVVAVGTGLRQGEVFGITVDRVDFLRRLLRVDQQLVLLPGREPFLAPPKTAASHRTVPLPQVVVDALAAHMAAFPPGPDGLIFANEKGEPIRRNRFSDGVWLPAVDRASLPKGTHFHEARHYYASLLIRHGESVKVVQARLGHASAAETLDTYSHLWPDSEDRTRDAIDSVLGARSAFVEAAR